ncbi:MAG: ATP-binding protein [Pleurocapsa minor GSE-CHR-MK-17-07R]|nr:ATP-binding protein [Pleurocapsa minor GSE-CHR-MK 17-07R]
MTESSPGLNLTILLHDLKNKLGQIKGNIELVEMFGPLNDGQANSISRAFGCMNEMLEAINMFFNVEDADERADSAFTTVSWTAIYFEVASQLEMHARPKDITLELIHPSESIHFEANYMQCEHILLNLMGNAIKYGRPGGYVHVSTFLDQETSEVVLMVSDNGAGIPEHELAYVFDRNFRASNVADSRIEGGGMGLYIVHEVVEQHDGTISLASVEGEGTTITIRLPLIQSLYG